MPKPPQYYSTSELAQLKEQYGKAGLIKHDPRMQYLFQFGHGYLAYSSLQANINYFLVDDIGYIAYRQAGNKLKTIHVIGDPVACPTKLITLLKAFLAEYPQACFYHINVHTAKILHQQFGFYANEIGRETKIAVQQFRLTGKPMADMRRFRNVSLRNNLTVNEVSLHQCDITQLQNISKDWQSHKPIPDRELNFLSRPMIWENEMDVRYLIMRCQQKIIGFSIYEPIYQDQQIIGYLAVIQRYLPNSPKGTADFANLHMIDQLKVEGKKYLSLGLAPLMQIEDKEPMANKWLTHSGRFIYEHTNWLYHCKQLAFHKARYRSHAEKVFFANPKRLPILNLYRTLKLCHLC